MVMRPASATTSPSAARSPATRPGTTWRFTPAPEFGGFRSGFRFHAVVAPRRCALSNNELTLKRCRGLAVRFAHQSARKDETSPPAVAQADTDPVFNGAYDHGRQGSRSTASRTRRSLIHTASPNSGARCRFAGAVLALGTRGTQDRSTATRFPCCDYSSSRRTDICCDAAVVENLSSAAYFRVCATVWTAVRVYGDYAINK
jgi:transposase